MTLVTAVLSIFAGALGAVVAHLLHGERERNKSASESIAKQRALAARVQDALLRLKGLQTREAIRGRTMNIDAYAACYEELRLVCSDLNAACASEDKSEWIWLPFSVGQLLSSPPEVLADPTREQVDGELVDRILAALKDRLPLLEEPDMPLEITMRIEANRKAFRAIEQSREEETRRYVLHCRESRGQLADALKDGYRQSLNEGIRRICWIEQSGKETPTYQVQGCIGAFADLLRGVRLPTADLAKVRMAVLALAPEGGEGYLLREIGCAYYSLGALLVDYSPDRRLGDELVDALRKQDNNYVLLNDEQLRVVLRVWRDRDPDGVADWVSKRLQESPSEQLRFLEKFCVPIREGEGVGTVFELELLRAHIKVEQIRSIMTDLANTSMGPELGAVLRPLEVALERTVTPPTRLTTLPSSQQRRDGQGHRKGGVKH